MSDREWRRPCQVHQVHSGGANCAVDDHRSIRVGTVGPRSQIAETAEAGHQAAQRDIARM
jgi:hypothetical protein